MLILISFGDVTTKQQQVLQLHTSVVQLYKDASDQELLMKSILNKLEDSLKEFEKVADLLQKGWLDACTALCKSRNSAFRPKGYQGSFILYHGRASWMLSTILGIFVPSQNSYGDLATDIRQPLMTPMTFSTARKTLSGDGDRLELYRRLIISMHERGRFLEECFGDTSKITKPQSRSLMWKEPTPIIWS